MNHLTLLLILLLSTKHNTQGLVPQGCSYDSGRYTCDFQEWIPPLQDKDFIPGPLNFLKMTNVNGTFPTGVSYWVLILIFPHVRCCIYLFLLSHYVTIHRNKSFINWIGKTRVNGPYPNGRTYIG